MVGLGEDLILSEDEGVRRRNPCLTPDVSPRGQRKRSMEKASVHLDCCGQSIRHAPPCCKKEFGCHSIEKEKSSLSLGQKPLSEDKDPSACIWNTFLIALRALFLSHDVALAIDSGVTSRCKWQQRWPWTRESRGVWWGQDAQALLLTWFASHVGYRYLYFRSQGEPVPRTSICNTARGVP